MNQPSTNSRSPNKPPVGETYVWVTGMGLAIGLIMITFLLGLIVRNGVSVFWPKRVAEMTFRDDRDTRFRGGLSALGVVIMEQARDARDLTPEQVASPDPADRREKRVFIGNRDVFGQSFSFFNVGNVERISFPENVIRAERLEWGDALLFPLRLRDEEGRIWEADDPDFDETLTRLVREAGDRRSEINRIERFSIGRINLQMRDLELQERYFTRQETLTPEQEREQASIRQRMAKLQAEFDPLAAQAGALRAQQIAHTLEYRVISGDERSLPVGHIVYFYYPNRINTIERARVFVHQLWDFLSGFPREANTEGGIFPAIFGTFVMTLIMSVAVMPFGVMAAIYLREYARQGPLVRSVRIAINNLAGVPSIVFGIFGLGFFVYFVGGSIDNLFFSRALPTPTFGTGGMLWASLTLALMTVPVVIVATEEALAAVSRGVREGSLACGASKWQTIQHLVLPASAPGILTGLVLAMARGAGEVAPLMLVGVVALAPNLPVDGLFPFIHLERKFMHLGFHIYDLGFQSPDSDAAQPMVFATTLVLILLVVVLNLLAIIVRNHLKKKYAAGTF